MEFRITDTFTDSLAQFVSDAAKTVPGHEFGGHFLLTEWDQMVDVAVDANGDVVARELGRKRQGCRARSLLLRRQASFKRRGV
jgi:hypothetical protein